MRRFALGGLVVVAALFSTSTSRAVAQSVIERDSASLAALLLSLPDTTPGVRERVTEALRARARDYVPILEEWTGARDLSRSGGASAALVLIGPAAYPAVRRALLDPERRFSAQFALDLLDGSPALLALLSPWLEHPDPALRAAAVGALEVYRDDSELLMDAIVGALEDPHPDVRAAALGLHLSQIGSDSAQRRLANGLMPFLDSPIASERRAAAYILGNSHPHGRTALPIIRRLAEHDEDVEVRWLSARILTWQRADPSAAQPVLLRMMADSADTVRVEALLAMGGIGLAGVSSALSDSVIRSLESRLVSNHQWTREAAATALAYIGAPAVRAMIAALRSSYTAVAVTAAEGLSAMPQLSEIDAPLIAALSDPRSAVREAAALALVGPGERVEGSLHSLAGRGPDAQRAAASMALSLIDAQRLIDVADRCYRISYDAWLPALPFATIEGLIPPTAIRFRPIVAQRPVQDRPALFVIEQNRDGAWGRSGWWQPDTLADELRVNASPQLSGIELILRSPRPGTLEGVARTYWDFRREQEEARVRLEEFSCAETP